MENLVYFAEEVNPVLSLVALVGRVLINTCKKYWNTAKQPHGKYNIDYKYIKILRYHISVRCLMVVGHNKCIFNESS